MDNAVAILVYAAIRCTCLAKEMPRSSTETDARTILLLTTYAFSFPEKKSKKSTSQLSAKPPRTACFLGATTVTALFLSKQNSRVTGRTEQTFEQSKTSQLLGPLDHSEAGYLDLGHLRGTVVNAV
jgi:hypothetical protein